MRRLMMLGMLPVFAGLFWAVACQRDNYRDVLPLRPFGDAAAEPYDLLPGPPADLSRTGDMPMPPDMTVPPPDMATPPADLTVLPDLTPADM